jgi:hypothetical protein
VGSLESDLAELVAGFGRDVDKNVVDSIVAHGDQSSAWLMLDLVRFQSQRSPGAATLLDGVIRLGIDIDPSAPWKSATNALLADDVSEPPGYEALKVEVLSAVDARWRPLLEVDNDLDFRWLGWGGVFIDDRTFGDASPCFGRGCIPALDSPGVTDAAGGFWYPDDEIVFGIVVNGEARAYQKNIMQVHEMVNDQLGGRTIVVPYCTLCGSAQAFFTDELDGEVLDEPLVFRTSGLLSRSNKVMYELGSQSIFDTFTGRARSGPMFVDGVHLAQLTVSVSTWGEWRSEHPDTTIIAGDGGVGRVYPEDPLFGRDDSGPIFPIGELDDRLTVHHPVVGAVTADGVAVAFDAIEARAVLADGGSVVALDEDGTVIATVSSDGAGLSVTSADGLELATHESFWFAWSQFWPQTLLWANVMA